MRCFVPHPQAIRLWAGVIAALLVCHLAPLAEARVGGGQSFGSRGSRSFSAPVRPSTPAPRNAFSQPSVTPAPFSSARSQGPFSRSLPPSSSSGSVWRTVGGGLVGGFLGSMLFHSLGFGGGGLGANGYAGGGWGGPGLFDLLLVGLIGYVAYRFFSKQSARPGWDSATESAYTDSHSDRFVSPDILSSLPLTPARDLDQGIADLRVLDPGFDPARLCDESVDFFFRLQAAWSARDLSPLRSLMTDDLAAQLQADIDQLKGAGTLNHIENIAVRTTELTEAWQEVGQDYACVYFYANCLDYDVSEPSGAVIRGSKVEPSKFEEYWTFTRPSGSGRWKLAAITQAESRSAA